MTNEKIDNLLKTLLKNQWKINTYTNPLLVFENERINQNLERLPNSFLYFLSYVQSAVNLGDSAWFLCKDDYNEKSDAAFKWNEFEKESLEAAKEFDDLYFEIKKFWDSHLPIMLSVKRGYSHISLSLCENSFGAVVLGDEPEYEEVEKITSSFDEFIEVIINHLEGKEINYNLSLFL